MTNFAEGRARNLALDSGGTIASTLDGANPSIYGYRPEYIPINLGNSVSLGETVRLTVSFDLVMTVATANPALQVYNSNNKGPMVFSSVNALAGEVHTVGETIEKRVAVTASWSPRSDANKPTNFLEFYSTYGTGNYFSISNLMVELGEVAHPWRPAPEDLSGVSDMVIATDTRTLAVTVDVEKVETFYYQTASTASAPSKPITATPSGWQATEFAFDVSKAVWTCQKTTLSDGTFRWGEVSKWGAYEGAVVSKNAADAAQSTANSANAREQRIYKSAASGTASMAATETWVASTADAQNAWTAKRPTFSRDYPVLFTATQRQTVAQQAAGSACSCTVPYVDESAAVAGNYITKVSTGGDAWVHSEGHGPDANGDATANTYGWRIGSVFELVRAGLSYLKMWVDNSVAKVRVGLENAGHSIFSPDGMEVFTGANASVAKFGSTARIGKASGESRMELDYHSLKLIDREGDTYFHVGDLREEDGSLDVSDWWLADGERCYFFLSNTANSTGYTVKVDGTAVTSGIMKTQYLIKFSTAPSDGAYVAAQYTTEDQSAKALTFGTRASGRNVGGGSVAIGDYCAAIGRMSVAVGSRTIADGNGALAFGNNSRAEGRFSAAIGTDVVANGDAALAAGHGTVAASAYQTAVGMHNDNQPAHAFEVGNGTDDDNRSNAFAVGWDGDVECGDVNGVEISDSGWNTLTLASGWVAYETAQAPKYRKIGPLVEICGAVKPTTAMLLDGNAVAFGTLPAGYRPNSNRLEICQASGTRSWLLTVYPSGNLGAARLRAQDSTSYQTAATTEWLAFHIMYFVD